MKVERKLLLPGFGSVFIFRAAAAAACALPAALLLAEVPLVEGAAMAQAEVLGGQAVLRARSIIPVKKSSTAGLGKKCHFRVDVLFLCS